MRLYGRLASQFQSPDNVDGILDYPTYFALVEALTIPGPRNISAFVDMITQSEELYNDTSILGLFLEDQDVPRWCNLSVDPQSL